MKKQSPRIGLFAIFMFAIGFFVGSWFMYAGADKQMLENYQLGYQHGIQAILTDPTLEIKRKAWEEE